jgi:hypothetical protein
MLSVSRREEQNEQRWGAAGARQKIRRGRKTALSQGSESIWREPIHSE